MFGFTLIFFCLIQYCLSKQISAAQSQVIQVSSTDKATRNKDQSIETIQGYQELLLQLLKDYASFHTLILIYDEELDQSKTSVNFIQELHKLNAVITSINLAHDKDRQLRKTFGTSNQGRVLEALLRRLYGNGKVGTGIHIKHRYLFIVWVKNPNILYARSSQEKSTTSTHPGWIYFDRVALVQTENSNFASKSSMDIAKMEFWKHIPLINGIRKSTRDSNLINIYLVECNGGKESSYKNLLVWNVGEKRFYRERRKVQFFSRKRFSNLQGASLPVGTIWKDPFLIWGNKLHPYLDGLDWRLSKLVERHLNFSGNLVNADKIGRFENGNWTGVLGMLQTGAISFALGGIPVTPERLRAFGFSTTYYTDAYSFISPIRVMKPKVLDVFMQPFQEKVWIALGITGVCIILTLFLVANIEKLFQKSRGSSITEADKWFTNLQNNTAFFATQVFQKPYHHAPKSNALKFIFYGASLGINILGIMFVTFMIANMSAPWKRIAVDAVDDILPSKIPLDIRDYDGELNSYLQREKPKLLKSAYMVDWLESCHSIRSVSEGTRIYMDSKARLSFMASYEYNQKKIFSFHLASEDVLGGVNLAWPMRKNWPFKRAIDEVITRAVESGLVQYWMNNFKRGKFAWDGDSEAVSIAGEHFLVDWNSVIKKLPSRKREHELYTFEPIATKELSGILLMYQTGCLVAIAVFLLEHVTCFISILAEMFTWLSKEMYQACSKVVTNNINAVKRTKLMLHEKLSVRTSTNRGKTNNGQWIRKRSGTKGRMKSASKTANQDHLSVVHTRTRQRPQSNTSGISWYSFDSPFNYLK